MNTRLCQFTKFITDWLLLMAKKWTPELSLWLYSVFISGCFRVICPNQTNSEHSHIFTSWCNLTLATFIHKLHVCLIRFGFQQVAMVFLLLRGEQPLEVEVLEMHHLRSCDWHGHSEKSAYWKVTFIYDMQVCYGYHLDVYIYIYMCIYIYI